MASLRTLLLHWDNGDATDCFLPWHLGMLQLGSGSWCPGPASFPPCPACRVFLFLSSSVLTLKPTPSLGYQNLLHLRVLIKSCSTADFVMQFKSCPVCRENLREGALVPVAAGSGFSVTHLHMFALTWLPHECPLLTSR